MGAMIIPLAVVLVAGLIVLGLVVADRYPISTWPARIRRLVEDARQEEEPVEVVTQEERLSYLMTLEGPSAITRTDSFEGQVSFPGHRREGQGDRRHQGPGAGGAPPGRPARQGPGPPALQAGQGLSPLPCGGASARLARHEASI